jgi:hypothetical protein
MNVCNIPDDKQGNPLGRTFYSNGMGSNTAAWASLFQGGKGANTSTTNSSQVTEWVA